MYIWESYSDCRDFLTDFEIATSREIGLVEALNGMAVFNLQRILFTRTGYYSFRQYYKEIILGEEEE